MSSLVGPTFNVQSVLLNNSLDAGMPGPEHFTIVDSVINTEDVEEGGILVQALVFSADPYLRGAIKTGGSTPGGTIMSGFIAGKVIVSKNSLWREGDLFGGNLKFSTYQIVSKAYLSQTVIWKLTGLIEESNISYGIGVLGMPGSTAYGGLLDILRPKQGETIFISAASGAVGALVGMLAKTLFNCKVIGSCGGPDKCALTKESFGFDYVIDYKTVNNAEQLTAKIKEVAPEGIDMYFENVGGMHLEAALTLLRNNGRVAICGQIADYNESEPAPSPFFPRKMIYTCQRIEGFVCYPWLKGDRGNFLKEMHGWLQEGKLKVQETTFNGITSWPLAFQSLFTGANTGKVVVRV